jgi:hypothetical protein
MPQADGCSLNSARGNKATFGDEVRDERKAAQAHALALS